MAEDAPLQSGAHVTRHPRCRTDTVMLALALFVGILSGMWIQQYRDTLSQTPPAIRMGGGTPAELVCSIQHRECRRALLALVNTDRAARGLPPYVLDWTQSRGTPSCAGSAGHSHAMAQSGSIWHVSAAYPAQSFPMNLCVAASAAGENAGVAMSGDRWADLVQIDNQMMAEPRTPGCSGNHACNLMSATFTRIGIGISSRDGATYLTEDFLQ